MPYLSLSSSYFWVALLCLLGLLIWFVIRLNEQRFWFPIIQVIRLRKKLLPNLKMKWPGFFPFVFFFILVLALLFMSAKPTSYIYEESPNLDPKAHIFIDMSPSVSAYIPLKDYVNKIVTLWESLNKEFTVTVSTSHNNVALNFDHSESLEDYLIKNGFHRPGAFIGSSINKTKNLSENINLLLIVSDQGQSSWRDFHWESLNSMMDIFFYDISTYNKDPYNIFIESVKPISTQNSAIMEWQVVFSRVYDDIMRKGVLKASLNDQLLISVPWSVELNQKRLIINVKIPRKTVESHLDHKEESTIVWSLEALNKEQLVSDNTFRTYLRENKERALVVSSPRGENLINEPSYNLRKALEIQGLTVKKIDKMTSDLSELRKFNLVVIQLDDFEDLNNMCPVSIDEIGIQDKNQVIWLMPQTAVSGYRNLCMCYSLLTQEKSKRVHMNKYCVDNMTPVEFNETMRSLGSEQIGGNVTSFSTSIGWLLENKEKNIQVMAFNIPLRPRAFGLSHASLPILTGKVLKYLGVKKDSHPINGSFPRIADFSTMGDNESSEIRNQILNSNVPLNESMLKVDQNYKFPPSISENAIDDVIIQSKSRKKESPLSWIYWILILVLFVTLLEVFYLVFNFRKKSSDALVAILLFVYVTSSLNNQLFAKVEINYLTDNNIRFSVSKIAKTTKSRTSLEISESVKYHIKTSKELYLQPCVCSVL